MKLSLTPTLAALLLALLTLVTRYYAADQAAAGGIFVYKFGGSS